MKKGIISLTIVCLLVLSLVLSFGLINGSRNVCYGLNNIPSSLEGGSCGQFPPPACMAAAYMAACMTFHQDPAKDYMIFKTHNDTIW